MISEESIRAIKNQHSFAEFRDHIISVVDDLNSVSGLESLPNAVAGEEAKIRSKTIDKLMAILRPFVDFKEKKQPTIEQIQKVKEMTGL